MGYGAKVLGGMVRGYVFLKNQILTSISWVPSNEHRPAQDPINNDDEELFQQKSALYGG